MVTLKSRDDLEAAGTKVNKGQSYPAAKAPRGGAPSVQIQVGKV